MATTKKIEPASKLTAAQARAKVDELQDKLDKYSSTSHCPMCGKHKDIETKFYYDTDILLGGSSFSRICRDCAKSIACRRDKNGVDHEPTKESVIKALFYLNKPFIESLWNSSIQEADNMVTGKVKENAWTAYIKNVQMKNYVGMGYLDSDFYKIPVIYDDERTPENQIINKDILNEFEQNKKDSIRLLGYDPFEKEQISDQPFLYSNLIGYLDSSEDANEDRMRTSSIIEIVKGFNHIEKMNDMISSLMSDVKNMERNIVTIKNLEDTKNKITNSVLNLARDNGISLKHSVNASKGENTWTGKVRKMKEMNLRDAEVNLYNTEYADGLKQVAEISDAAIIKQIKLDENDYNDMLIQQRELINKYKKIADDNEEKARVLLRENYDLKDLIKKNNIEIQYDQN